MRSTIYYEFRRIFIRPTLITLAVLVLASLYFTYLGITDYRNFQEAKKNFIIAEKSKLNFYFTYEQYGATGFRVILESSPLSVFFNRYNFTRGIEARIDLSEILSIYNRRKGEKVFSVDSRFGDLHQSMTIFGSLIMMIMGFLTFPNRYHIEYFSKRHYVKSIFARILLLDIFFLLLLSASYAFARFWGVTFLPQDHNFFFIVYAPLALLLLDIFFFSGLIIKALCKYKKNTLHILMITWFIFIFFLPEIGKVYRSTKISMLTSGEKLDMEKLKILLNTEFNNRKILTDFLAKHPAVKPESPEMVEIVSLLYKNYLGNGYKTNKKMEENFLRDVKKDIDYFSFLSIFFPLDFLNLTSTEISGTGFDAYIDFNNYIFNLKDKFMHFYGQKRYKLPDADRQIGVESFIKKNENVYRPKNCLPVNFAAGTIIMVIYIVLLSGLTYYTNYINRDKKIPSEPLNIFENIKPGLMLFLLVNKKKQEEIVAALKQRKRSILQRTSSLIINKEVSVQLFIDYACREKKIKKHIVMENLELFAFLEKDLHMKVSKYTEECKQKLICSLVFAEADEIVVINDFIKGASYEFEKQFLNLVSQQAGANRKIVYLGSEIYTPSSSLIKSDIKVKTYLPFYLDPQKISLR